MHSPPRIAIMVDCLLAGGAERIAVEVACALDRTRFQPVVLVTRTTGPLEQQLREADVPFVILDRGRGFSPRKLARAVRLIRRCDLLHAHKLEGSAWASGLARLSGRPLIALEQIWFGEPSKTRAFLYRWVIGRTARRIVCVSNVVAESVIADGAPADRVRMIPNAVRVGVAIPRDRARAELELPPDIPVAGIVARLRPQKRHDALLRTTKILDDEGRDFLVCIVGDGPLRDELHATARELGIEHRVRFAGEHRDAARLASAFDVSVMCSSSEGLPLAGLEAMACGVPLVSTAVSALPELLEGGAGVLVPPADDAALARAIGELFDDPVRARKIGENGLDRVRTRYEFSGMVKAMEDLFDEVLRETA